MTVIKYYDVATSTWKTGTVGAASGQVWPTVIGDGVSTSFQVTHGFGTRNVVVTVYRAAPPYDEVEVDVERTTESYVTIRTSPTVPAVGEYIAVVASAGTQATLDITMDSWHLVGGSGEPAFQNSWVNNASPATYPVAAFRKDPTGRVALRGLVNGGTTGVAMFTLPVDYRPSRALFFPTDANGAYARITVNADGTVVHSAGATSNVNLNVIEFDTDTVLRTASLTAQPIESWHTIGGSGEPVFQGTWVNDTAAITKFRKYPDGKVRISGRIRTGTIGSVAFTLPAGYRPTQLLIFDALSHNGTTQVQSEVRIGTDGTVTPTAGSSANWFSVEGIEFDTESVSAYAVGALTNSVIMDPWHLVGAAGEPAFAALWANFNASNDGTVGFRKTPDGKVQIKGIAQISAGGGATVFTLPTGYRPARPWRFCVAGMGGATYFVVNVDGTVTQQNVTGYYTLTANAWYDLSVIEFDTESVTQLSNFAAQPMDTWHPVGAAGEPVFQNSWVNYGAPYGNARFRKFPDGRVRLAGAVKTGAAGSVAFTLPVGYRPPFTILVPMTVGSGTSYLSIGSDGTITPTTLTGTPSTVTFLDNVEFDTEAVISYPSAFLSGPTRVTVLPAAPIDGQEIYYVADATNGVIWHLRYNAASASAYKWEFVGGAPIRAWDNNNYTFATGAGYNPPSAGVYVTTALAGDYEVSFGSYVRNDSGASTDLWTAVRIGAAAAVDANAVDVYLPNGEYLSVARTVFVTQPTAGANLSLEHKNLGGNFNTTVNRRFIAARPVRVG
jgi:hypothetical protein